jgi:hypothetical protein
LQAGIDRLYERLPFVANWNDAAKKLRKEPDGGLGWDDLLSSNNDALYVKGRGEHQGTSE